MGSTLAASAACRGSSSNTPGKTEVPTGKTRLVMSRGKADLMVPPSTPAGETWRYGLAFPFQVASDKAALFCNIKGKRGQDFEIGTDAIIFDNLSEIRPKDIFPISRNHTEPNPKSTPPGKPAIIVKYPVGGGFVPLGARRTDGTPHPHAGTGFGVCEAIAWTTDQDSTYRGAEAYTYLELQQYRYDGNTFEVLSTERLALNQLLPGYTISNVGIVTAIPDADDLLYAMAGNLGSPGPLDMAHAGQTGLGSGVVRWQHSDRGWRPVSFVLVTGSDRSFEPTLIRDTDGSLLLCARGTGEFRTDIRLWRSQDGQAWNQFLHVRGVISGAPISINQASNGTPFVASNLYQVLLHPFERARKGKKSDRAWASGQNASGGVRGGGWDREKLVLFPLSEDRSQLETPMVVRDAFSEFGRVPSGDTWNVDHPSAKTVRLADGKWHTVVAMRICDHGEVQQGTDPASQTGIYIEEIFTEGASVPSWQF